MTPPVTAAPPNTPGAASPAPPGQGADRTRAPDAATPGSVTRDPDTTTTAQGAGGERDAFDATLAATVGPDEPGDGPARADRELRRGALVGRYVVLSTLGAGAMGVVYAAYDPDLDRKVALKLLHPRRRRAAMTSEGHRRLLREAQAMAKLAHPNVVTVHDVGELDGRVYVAMAFIDGQTLSDWLDAGPHPWTEVLQVFSQAARGLAAAHDQGLVHRDFKPDNVMLGRDGRVRVMDFGLARPSGAPDRPTLTAASDPAALRPRTDALASEVTRAGAIVGTPAYMAPEQWLGGDVGPPADQFSFCVAFWQALYGQRPFSGDTPAQLAFAVTQGKLLTPPRGRKAPRWLLRVLRRGLSARPEDRWPSMDALLAALARGRVRARVQTIAAALAAVTLLGAGAEGYRRYDHSQRVAACQATGDAFVPAWDDDTRARVRSALESTGFAYAASTADKALPYLDRQARALRAARTQVCLHTSVQGTWDRELAARSTWCLDERRMELSSLVEQLEDPDAAAVQNAVQAAASAPKVAPCLDASLLERLPPPPEDREAATRVRATLSRAHALQATAQFDRGLALARQALSQAQALASPLLIAEARARVGTLLDEKTAYSEAAATLEDAYFDAMLASAKTLAAHIAINLVSVVGDHLARYESGMRWSRHAKIALALAGEPHDGLEHAEWLHALGTIEYRKGTYDASARHQRRAIELFEANLGPRHPTVANSLIGLAMTRHAAGEYDEAIPLFRRALTIFEDALGPKHPKVAICLSGLASVYSTTGRYDEAISLYRRALDLQEDALGPRHPSLARTLNNLAIVYQATGDLEEAAALQERAIEIHEATQGSEHPDVATAINNLANVRREMGDLEDAQRLFERALEIKRAAFGPDHPSWAQSLHNLALVHEAMGDMSTAADEFRQALAVFERALGSEHPMLAYPLTALARAALAQGRPREAIPLAERAVRLRTSGTARPEDVAASRFVLARALWAAPKRAGGDRSRALAEAKAAASAYRELDGKEQELTKVEAWIRAHEAP